MCGIVGLYLKDKQQSDHIGEMFADMLICMSERGPDSAGFAIYGDETPAGVIKVTLRQTNDRVDWPALRENLDREFGGESALTTNATYAVVQVSAEEPAVRGYLKRQHPSVRVMSVGRRIEILKEVGNPASIVERFNVRKMRGSHVIGHTRMATESAVTTEGSHPFSTGMDLCLVHNGSLSNYNRLRRRLQRYGIEFRTENDSEVAAGYLMWRLREGDTLKESLEAALRDLDGFYTFAIGTADGFAVLRDPIACKPAVMAENNDYVAIASEYRALARLPGIADAKVWEPEPAIVYTWGGN